MHVTLHKYLRSFGKHASLEKESWLAAVHITPPTHSEAEEVWREKVNNRY